MSSPEHAISLREARSFVAHFIPQLQPFCDRIEVAGSVRREVPWINDIEIVAIPKATMVDVPDHPGDFFQPATTKKVRQRDPGWGATIERLAAEVVKGRKLNEAKYTQFITHTGIKVDLFTALPDTWGYIMAIRTGSVTYSQGLASRWSRLGYKGEDGVLTRHGKPIPVREEVELFGLIGIAYVEPRYRL